MNRDNEIDKLFKGFKPDIDTGDVLKNIRGKMDIIDTVRSEQERLSRFHRMIAIGCFIAGLSIGLVLISIVLFAPSGILTLVQAFFNGALPKGIAQFCLEFGNISLLIAASACIILGALPVINHFSWSR